MSKFLNISTDNTLGGSSASDDTVSSQKAVKEYVDSHGGGSADTDLSNLTSQGQNIANWSTNVINCITEIPQDIKLEINSSGKAVLKAGSKVYIPNGFTGTTPKFDIAPVNSDITYNFSSLQNGKYLLANTNNGQSAGWARVDSAGSGTSTESNTSFYYRTDDNKVYYQNNSSGIIYTLPLAIVNLTNGVATIEQVFNGFGYIGSTVFALPGVKGLIPNGRNADGSLKSISFEISSVINSTLSYGEGEYYLGYIDGGYIVFLRETITHYLKDENLILDDITGIKHNDWMFFGSFYANSSNKITSFTPKTTFHALDYNDSSTISGWSMPSSRYIDLTLGASGTSYTAPANGYIAIAKKATSTGQYIYMGTNSGGTPAVSITTVSFDSSGYVQAFLPVRKGERVKVSYTVAGTIAFFYFIYAEGEN